MPLSEILKCLKKIDFFYCRTKIAVKHNVDLLFTYVAAFEKEEEYRYGV